jgi:hypothetical protein
MSNVLSLHSSEERNARAAEASLLRDVIAGGRVRFEGGECEHVAAKLDDFIERHAAALGRGGVGQICEKVWGGKDANQARRRSELRATKGPKTLMGYAKRIAEAINASEDDVLLAAFRGTHHERVVSARRRGVGAEPELEAFWVTLSDTLHALTGAVVRAEGLTAHMERLIALHGRYDLAADAIRPSPNRLLCQPLASWNEHVSHFPPIPSVVLFSEPKSVTVERLLMVRGTGQAMPVQMTVLREVRLAIGPADELLVPAPLFEFRSVIQLVGPAGPMRIRLPWLRLDEDEVDVEIDGVWRTADVPFDGGDPDRMPEGFVAEPHVAKYTGPRLLEWRFPAKLEAPLQYEHDYVVWCVVTAGTCRELLLRPRGKAELGPFAPEPPGGRPDLFCPPGTLAEAIEAALHVSGPEGLADRLRTEAAHMSALVRGWHAERAGAAEAAHRGLRAEWEKWT